MRYSQSFGGRFFGRGDLTAIRDGLCKCEGLIDEVEAARDEIVKSKVRILENRQTREITAENLGCGMV